MSANRAQVQAAIRLANAYPDVVVAIVVGNETQVSWSDHRVPLEQLIRAVRAVRAATSVPVTTVATLAAAVEDAAPVGPGPHDAPLHGRGATRRARRQHRHEYPDERRRDIAWHADMSPATGP